MAANTLLQQICEANKNFLAGRSQPLDPAGDPFVVLSCIDGRLTGLLEPALGLPKNRALLIRTAGNRVSEAPQEPLRSIAVAVYIKGARELFIVGHSDCALSKFSAAEVIEGFRGLGVPRSAFGNEDLRAWFGAFTNIESNVLQSIDCIRKSGVLPVSIKIHGLILNTEDGKLDVILNGDTAPTEKIVSVREPAAFETPPPAIWHKPELPVAIPDIPAPPPSVGVQDELKISPVVIPESKPEAGRHGKPSAPTSMLDAAMIFRDFLRRERRNQKLQRNLSEIGNLLKREKDPVVIIHQLEKIVREYQQQYPNLPAALAFSRKLVEGKSAGGANFMEMMRRILS